jgi:hypothetical protein
MRQPAVTTTLEDVAIAALSGDSLRTRSLMQDWISGNPNLAILPLPISQDPTTRSLIAALAELMAERRGQTPPSWAADIGPAPNPTHLLRSALQMKRLRDECERSAPSPLRRRRFYAPPNYLEML